MVSPIVSTIRQSGVNSALSCVGVTADGMNFADYGDVNTVLTSRKSSSHPGKTSANYQYVMIKHSTLPLSKSFSILKIT
jgi:hypothetical protein